MPTTGTCIDKPDTAALLTFVAALLALEATPGPDMMLMLVLARGIGHGRRTALLTAVGMVPVAGTVQLGDLVLGVASLLQAHPAALLALRRAGAACLSYPGRRVLRASAGGAVRRPRWPTARPGRLCAKAR